MSLASAASVLAEAGAAIAPKRPIKLFNGKNLNGLYTWLRETKYEDPKRVFSVRDGMLRVSGEDWGGIGTRAAYRDYHLTMEWRWGGPALGKRSDKARDSGILLHAVGPDGAYSGVWPDSFECQIIEGGCGDFIVVGAGAKPTLSAECRLGPDGQHYWKAGEPLVTKEKGRFNWWGRDVQWKDTLGFRGREDVERPTGEWNRSECICAGDSITNLVNGVVVNRGVKASRSEGKIMLQSEGAEILVRRWELAPLRKS
jgi:hypothetical protein